MLDEEDAVGFVIWTAQTGNASRAEWEKLGEGGQDEYRRMARVAIRRMRELQIVD